MNHDEHFDNLLDEALNEYRDAEPLTGLEARVLARLQTAKPARVSPWLRWGIAAACAAAVALALWIGMARRTSQTLAPADKVAAQSEVVTPSQQPAISTKGPAIASSNSRVQSETSRPRITATAALTPSKPAIAEVFPVPLPLSDAERALMAALQKDPQAAPPASDTDAVIAIAEIKIKPLSLDIESSGDTQ
jgi:cytoskeletal protein RodZ